MIYALPTFWKVFKIHVEDIHKQVSKIAQLLRKPISTHTVSNGVIEPIPHRPIVFHGREASVEAIAAILCSRAMPRVCILGWERQLWLPLLSNPKMSKINPNFVSGFPVSNNFHGIVFRASVHCTDTYESVDQVEMFLTTSSMSRTRQTTLGLSYSTILKHFRTDATRNLQNSSRTC